MKMIFCCLLFVLFSGVPSLWACSLPAYPIGAALPRANQPGVILVEGVAEYFYLVPEGTPIEILMVWDPAEHNTNNFPRDGNYEWVTDKAGLPPTDTVETGESRLINGYGFFPIEAMSQFFTVMGNRGDINEAFRREIGVDLGQGFFPSLGMNPSVILGEFAKSEHDGAFQTLNGRAPGWEGQSILDLPGAIPNTPVDESDNLLPGPAMASGWPVETLARTPSENWPDANRMAISNGRFLELSGGVFDSGLHTANARIELINIEPENFRGFVENSTFAAGIHMEGIDIQPSDRARGPSFTVNFTTPTISGSFGGETGADSLVKIKVDAPRAGFEVRNLYWCWTEIIYSPTQVAQDPDDPDSEMVTVYQRSSVTKASIELELIVFKETNPRAYTGYKVYSTRGPLASEFELTGSDEYSETGPTTLDFRMHVVDSNPFFAATFVEQTEHINVSQTPQNMALEIFYAYPTYEYEIEEDLTIAQLKSKGLANLNSDNTKGLDQSFDSYTHTNNWHWKKATVDATSLQVQRSGNYIRNGAGKIIGSENVITGQFTINNPRPWHVYCNPRNDSELRLGVFAIMKDTAGNSHLVYDDIVNIATDEPDVSADLLASDGPEERAVFTDGDGNVIDIPFGESVNDSLIIAGSSLNDSDSWQNMTYLKNEDDIAPEIQLIVFDTRTNKHHVFGTTEHTASGFHEFENKWQKDHESIVNSAPYHGNNAVIEGNHTFDNLSDKQGLFTEYLQGDDAVSTVSDGRNVGFVCSVNTRLVFYVRAFDNMAMKSGAGMPIGYMDSAGGIESLEVTMTDHNGDPVNDLPGNVNNLDAAPFNYVFRNETVNNPYILTVTAQDYSENQRTLNFHVEVFGRSLEIRTLEERRQRVQ